MGSDDVSESVDDLQHHLQRWKELGFDYKFMIDRSRELRCEKRLFRMNNVELRRTIERHSRKKYGEMYDKNNHHPSLSFCVSLFTCLSSPLCISF